MIVRAFLLLLLLAPAAAQDRGAHPRLLFRAHPGKNVPTLDEVVAKSKQAPWSQRVGDLKETTHGLALHWLITGEEASARACLEQLRAMKSDEGYGLYVQGPCFTLPVAYDWLSPWKGFAEKDRRDVEAKIVKTADDSVAFLKGNGDCVWHTSAPRAVMAIGLAGLALEGHHAKAGEYQRGAIDYLEKTYFPAMQHIDGGGVAGPTYAIHEGFAPLCFLLWALRTAKDIDYFAKEKWLAARIDYMVHHVLPDLTLVRWGDAVGGSRCGCRDETRGIVDMMARGTDSAAGWALSARIAARYKDNRQGYDASVLPTGFVFARDTKETAIALPTARMFGEKSIGQAFFRTGWDDDDTVVFFKAGDYFDNHGHFDQGAFTVWRRGPLAVDAGVYTPYDDHRQNFTRTSIAHNTLVVGPDDARGRQRIVEYQDVQDMADHEQKQASKKGACAEVVAWKSEKDYAYVSADLTAAYDPEFAKLVTRELVWTRGLLIVFDKVETASRARWLMHAVGDVVVEGQQFIAAGKGAQLRGVTLLPKKAKIAKVKSHTVDGREYAPSKKAEFDVPGEWRVEVENGGGSAIFLHVLAAVDAGGALPAVTLVEKGDEAGVEVGGRQFMFKKTGVSRAVGVK